MKRLIATFALLLSVAGTSCAQDTPPIDVSGLSEASMSFDQEGVGPFLSDLSEHFDSGFGSKDAAQLTSAVDSLSVDQTGNWEFTVTANGKSERIVIVAFKDDIDAPDLAFYSSPELADRIQKQLEAFAAAQGW